MPPKSRQKSRNLIEQEGRLILAIFALKSNRLAPYVRQHVFIQYLNQLYETGFMAVLIALRKTPIAIK